MKSSELNDLENNLRNKDRKKARQGKEHKVIRSLRFTPQVEDKFNNIPTVSPDYIKKITDTKYSCPVISLYLNFGPARNIRDPKNFISYYNSLKTEMLKKQKDYLANLTHSQEQSLKKDLDEISVLLEKQLIIEAFQSIIIFKSNDELHTIIKLPLDIKDSFSIEMSPYTSPLEGILQEQKRILLVRLNKDETDFYIYQLGHYQQVNRIEFITPTDQVDKSRPHKMQLHRLDHLQRHFDQVNEYVYKNIINQQVDYVVIIGHEKTSTKKFIDSMHEESRSRLLDTANLSPHEFDDKEKIYSVIDRALEKYELNLEELALNELHKAKGQGKLIEGIEQVIKAMNRGLLTTLYVSSDCTESGYICPERHYLSLEKAVCRLCNKKLTPVKNCVDELVELAAQQNVDTVIFTRLPGSMKPFQDIAALIYLTS